MKRPASQNRRGGVLRMAFRDFRETGPRPVGKGTGASATPTFLLANDYEAWVWHTSERSWWSELQTQWIIRIWKCKIHTYDGPEGSQFSSKFSQFGFIFLQFSSIFSQLSFFCCCCFFFHSSVSVFHSLVFFFISELDDVTRYTADVKYSGL